ncbi:hypothetical protein, partial [Escherichia coli]|uniref:hypothetical protein n=1 Tax=Escherichia coli TaxID=562 RepID=UPI001BFCBC01
PDITRYSRMQVHYLPLPDALAKAVKMRYISLRSKKTKSCNFSDFTDRKARELNLNNLKDYVV